MEKVQANMCFDVAFLYEDMKNMLALVQSQYSAVNPFQVALPIKAGVGN